MPQPRALQQTPQLALTPTEYNNSIRDLLAMPLEPAAWPPPHAVAEKLSPKQGETKGVFGSNPIEAPPWPWIFPDETGVEEFEGIADGQEPSPYSVEQLQKAAIHFAAYALVSPVFFTCEGWESLAKEEQEACAYKSIERFTQRAWRRPTTSEERKRLKTFWDDNWKNGAADEAVALTVAGVLQAPGFVFRLEHAPATKNVEVALDNWQMASRLSYFLWDSMPDPALFDAAARGKLSTAAGVEAQARRMLEDPRARQAVMHFHEQWLGTKGIHGISPARREYGSLYGLAPQPPLDTTGDGEWPSVLGPVRHSMEAETKLFVERTVFDGAGTLEALFTDNHGYMSGVTAPLYGTDAKVLGGPTVTWNYGIVSSSLGNKSSVLLQPVEFPAEQRAGVLTLPSVLALGSYAVHPAPVQRGKRILVRLACEVFGTPPPGVEAFQPPDTSEAESTNRIRTEDATDAPLCRGCHGVINPPGFAFEHYDAMGRWRAEDNGKPVNASGSFKLASGEEFTFKDGVDLSRQLGKSRAVKDCYVLRWARYATGVHIQPGDASVSELQADFRKSDHVKELLVAIAKSDVFRFRRVGGK